MKGISLIRLDFDPFGELLFSRVVNSKSVKIKALSVVKNWNQTIKRIYLNLKLNIFANFLTSSAVVDKDPTEVPYWNLTGNP